VSGINAAVNVFGEFVDVHIARGDHAPGGGDAYLRLLEICIGETDRVQHGTAGCVFDAINNLAGVLADILITHDSVLNAEGSGLYICANYTPYPSVTASPGWLLVSADGVLTHSWFALYGDSVNIGQSIFGQHYLAIHCKVVRGF
jgi:hypothetical protein